MFDQPRRRGELRIYLGAAPGVGKTYAMLGEARRRVERGTDVVVGFVETHGRARTAAMIGDLEVLPRRSATELDVDVVLARRPEVAVVDELAHTNVPGARNAERWQDVEELLDAGIDVLTTVNVQHLESLRDVVERITGVVQRETVPDEVVRGAEQVELVDITPEALRRRLAHGNVCPADRVDAALGEYFRPGNLAALRELALLWLAEKVDAAVQHYRAEHRIAETWQARERVVVGLSGGPECGTVLRRASRIRARLGAADLMAVHVLGGAGTSPAALAGLRRLADDLGASFHTVVGDDVPAALLDFARGADATQLVLGTSRRSRLARVFDEGVGARALRDAGPIDVHLVTHAEAGRGIRLHRLRSPLPPDRRVVGWLLAVLAPALLAGLGVLHRGLFTPSTQVVGFFLVTVVVAVVGGLGPALLAAIGSGLLWNVFFTQPHYSVAIYSPGDLVTMVALVVAAVLVALVVDQAARRAEQAARTGTEAALLAAFARIVLTRADPLPPLLATLREAFGLTSVALLERVDGRWRCVASAGEDDHTEPADAEPTDADAGVRIDDDVRLAVRGPVVPAHGRRVLEAVAGQALLALRQQRLAAATAEAQRRAADTELRTALLSAVGHDLRTPLTSIRAAVDSLRDPGLRLSTQDTAELLATIDESTDRLRGLVDNLLDSSRLAAGAVRPVLRPVGWDEIVALALSNVDGSRVVTVEVDERLPPVTADPGLAERVVANVVDNALRHAGGAPVSIRASAHAGRVELRVGDHGPGLPKGTADAVFAPFRRIHGRTGGGTGTGLGLSVAKGFTEAMGGTITAEDTPGGGLTVVISLSSATASTTAAAVIT